MKKIQHVAMLIFLIICLLACSDTTTFRRDAGKETAVDSEAQIASNVINEESVVSDGPVISVNAYTGNLFPKTEKPDEPKIEILSEIYTVNHLKDETTYFVILQEDMIPVSIAYPSLVNDPIYKDTKSKSFSRNHLVRLLDSKGNQIQTIPLEYSVFAGIYFEDVNVDGYLDIVIKTGGTMNETHELYIWDTSTQNFIKVIFEGFDMLSFFTVYGGYIDNFLRGSSPEESRKMKLIWKGNTLIKEKEY